MSNAAVCQNKSKLFYLCLTDAATGNVTSPAASKEGFQSKGGQGNQAQLCSQQGSSHPTASHWWLLNGAGSPTHSTCASQRPRQHQLWAPGRQKSGSFPEQTSWDTAPCSGATRMLQLHIPIFKQEKLKQRARAGFL